MTPEHRGFGQPGRSGPPGNSNAKKDGASIVRRERKELRQRAINGRTAEGRYVADQRGDLIASLGGLENVSVQKSWLVEEAAFLRLELAYLKAWLASQSPINKRKRAAHPIVKDYVGLVGALRGVLSDIGLERQSRQVPTLQEYLATRSAAAAPTEAVPTAATPIPAPAAATERGIDEEPT
jgi:hypothetical protein